MALLGHLLARRASTNYEGLLRSRLTGPLGMKASRLSVERNDDTLAMGHDRSLRPQSFHPSNVTLAGASELVSNVEDLTRFVGAALEIVQTPLRAALDRSIVPIASRDEYHSQMGLGWWVDQRRGRTFVWHGGESRDGFKSFIGLDPARRIGVVILSNSRNGVEDIDFLRDEQGTVAALELYGDGQVAEGPRLR